MAADISLTEFSTYDEYLDSLVTADDLFYLEDETIARQLVELGYRTTGKVLQKEEFEARKAAVETKRLEKLKRDIIVASANKDVTDPLMEQLAMRELDNRNGDLNTIVFIRMENSSKVETSGYIDFAHRLELEEWEGFFTGSKKLQPKPTDLSYYNWNTQESHFCDSPNFDVVTEHHSSGLQFRNKKDLKILDVDPNAESPGEDSFRYEFMHPFYLQVVIFDHYVRKKL